MNIPVIIINLKEKQSDLLRTFNELYKLDDIITSITRIDAIDKSLAKKLKYKYISYKAGKNIQHIKSTKILPTWSSVGCAISHSKCWEYIVNNRLDYALIVEDDIKLKNIDKLKYSINECMTILNSDRFDKIFISLNSKTNFVSYSILNLENIKNYYGQFIGTSAYFINFNCAKFLLKNIFPINNQIDIEMSKLFLKDRYGNHTGHTGGNSIACIHCDSGINNFNHVSSVQYYFITFVELKNLLQSSKYYFPDEILEIIYTYLPNRNLIKNNYYVYDYFEHPIYDEF